MDFSRLPQYGGNSPDPQPPCDGVPSPDGSAVETAIDVFLAYPNSGMDTILNAMKHRGIDDASAWKLYQLIPIAFIHVLLAGKGVEFQSGYVKWNARTDKRTHHWLRDEPIYVIACRLAVSRLERGVIAEQLAPVAWHSAEWDFISKVRKPAGDLRGIWLTEPLLVDYDDGD